MEADRGELGTDPLDRGVEVLEEAASDLRRDLASEPAVDLVLVGDQDAGGLAHAPLDRLEVERDEGAEVEDLHALPLLREDLGGLQREMDRSAVRDDR